MKQVLVIGDIHGAFKALQQILQRAEVQQDDQLIFLGDYVDGWGQSFEVIEYLLVLEKKMNCIFIKGNHDLWCQHWLEKNMPTEAWLSKGGIATVKSYQHVSEADKINHLRFFERMQNYFIDETDRLFIHAGFTSLQGPGMEHYSSTFSMDRTLWEMAVCIDKQIKRDSVLYPKRLKLFSEIFIGHTPTPKYGCFAPMNAANVWNIDTGASGTGKLTIMDVESKQFWQSDVVQKLYPTEAGRNRK